MIQPAKNLLRLSKVCRHWAPCPVGVYVTLESVSSESGERFNNVSSTPNQRPLCHLQSLWVLLGMPFLLLTSRVPDTYYPLNQHSIALQY